MVAHSDSERAGADGAGKGGRVRVRRVADEMAAHVRGRRAVDQRAVTQQRHRGSLRRVPDRDDRAGRRAEQGGPVQRRVRVVVGRADDRDLARAVGQRLGDRKAPAGEPGCRGGERGDDAERALGGLPVAADPV